jgi:hypothetical protein
MVKIINYIKQTEKNDPLKIQFSNFTYFGYFFLISTLDYFLNFIKASAKDMLLIVFGSQIFIDIIIYILKGVFKYTFTHKQILYVNAIVLTIITYILSSYENIL